MTRVGFAIKPPIRNIQDSGQVAKHKVQSLALEILDRKILGK